MAKAPNMKELAARIDAHLKRFEADPEINKPRRDGTHPYYQCGAWSAGRWLNVLYVDYQGTTSLTRTQAEQYLAWLDAGNVGRHWDAEREARGGAL